MSRLRFAFLVFAFLPLFSASAQPSALVAGLDIQQVAQIGLPGLAVRLVYLPGSDQFAVLTLDGDIALFQRPGENQPVVQVGVATFDSSDHGLTGETQGLTAGPDGSLYLVDTRTSGDHFVSSVVRRTPDGSWMQVLQTEPYPRSGTPFDHKFNGMVVSPDNRWLYIASGSRTDHGETQQLGGKHFGVREVPLTSALFRVPTDTVGVSLPADEAALASTGLMYADGFRNAFDLAFDGDGRLFAVDNGWDRDGPEELNLVVEGAHYGFPWKLGADDNPTRDPNYDPGSDLLLNPRAYAVSNGFYARDPRYPDPPGGLTFTAPIRNFGPDATRYRDPATGEIRSASDEGGFVSTFTAHGSPLGLVFDREGELPDSYQGDGFVMNWTGPGSNLFSPFGDPGEDLIHLQMREDEDGQLLNANRIVSGFSSPIDAVLVGRTMYVLEMSGSRGIWAITFADATNREGVPGRDISIGLPYPNPVQRGQTVRLAGYGLQSAVRVFDLLGRNVLTLPNSSGDLHIPTADLPAGLYLIRADGKTNVRLLTVIAP